MTRLIWHPLPMLTSVRVLMLDKKTSVIRGRRKGSELPATSSGQPDIHSLPPVVLRRQPLYSVLDEHAVPALAAQPAVRKLMLVPQTTARSFAAPPPSGRCGRVKLGGLQPLNIATERWGDV